MGILEVMTRWGPAKLEEQTIDLLEVAAYWYNDDEGLPLLGTRDRGTKQGGDGGGDSQENVGAEKPHAGLDGVLQGGDEIVDEKITWREIGR